MKTSKENLTQITKVIFSDVAGMDRFSFVCENYDGMGSMIIDTTSGAFSYIWGSMGTDTVEEFFLSAENDYLAGCFLRGVQGEERQYKFYALEKALESIREYLKEQK